MGDDWRCAEGSSENPRSAESSGFARFPRQEMRLPGCPVRNGCLPFSQP